MDVIRTIKKCVLPNGSVLRLFVTIEDMYFITLETTRAENHYLPPQTEKEILWSSEGEWQFDFQHTFTRAINNSREIAEREFEQFKHNPMIGGQDATST